MDILKQAFDRIKHDIFSLKQQIKELNQQIKELKLEKQVKNIQTIPTDNSLKHTSISDTPTHIPTIQTPIELLKPSNLMISTGNDGVPTDKQTNRQTDKQTDKQPKIPQNQQFESRFSEFEKLNQILDSLDNMKKEIRLKFKRLTSQEMLVFSTLYALEEQNIDEITYKMVAQNLNLSESSIRDYINKLIKKRVPILKIRQNNKRITLKISQDLKNIAPLSTIIKLREL